MQRRWTGVLVCVVVCGLSAACSGAPTTRAGEGAASTPPDAAAVDDSHLLDQTSPPTQPP